VKAAGRLGDNSDPPLADEGAGHIAGAIGAGEDLAELTDGEVRLIVHPEHGIELLEG